VSAERLCCALCSVREQRLAALGAHGLAGLSKSRAGVLGRSVVLCSPASCTGCLRRWLVGAYYMLVTILSVGCDTLRQWHGRNPLLVAWATALAPHARRCPAPRLPPVLASSSEAAACCLCALFQWLQAPACRLPGPPLFLPYSLSI